MKKTPKVKKVKVVLDKTNIKSALAAAKKIEEPTPPYFSVSLQLDKTVLEGKGATVLEALRAVPKPVKITTKSILTVQKGDKKHTRGLTIPLAKRLFYPGAQIYQAKFLEMLLK